MANTYNTSTLVGQQVVQSLDARPTLQHTVNTSYAKDYQNGSYVPGTTINMEINDQPSIIDGLVANVDDNSPRTVGVTIAGFNTSKRIDSLSRGYKTKKDAIRQWTDDMVKAMCRKVENTGFAYMAKQTGQNVGVPGTDTGSIRTWAEGRAKINDQLAEGTCYAAVNPMGMVALTEALKGAPNPTLSNSFVSARMKNMSDMNFYQTPSVYKYTAGTTTDGAGAVTTTSVNAASTLVLKLLGTGTITAGTKLTVASVYPVDPQTKDSLPYLKEFTVTADVTIAGNAATVAISPTIYDSTTTQQNVSALPQADAVVTLNTGGTLTASQTATQAMIYDKNAFTLVSLPLPLAEDGTEKNVSKAGLTVRIGQSSKDHINDTEIIKVSALWGWGKLREDHACAVFNA